MVIDNKKTVYVDEETKEKINILFDQRGKNFSEWMKYKVEQEYEQTEDPYILQKRIDEHEKEIAYLKERLKNAVQINQRSLSIAKKDIDFTLLKNMTKGICQTYDLSTTLAQKYAEEYLSIGEKDRPVLQIFMKTKFKDVEENNDIPTS